jgi:serine/threonine-protein kinase
VAAGTAVMIALVVAVAGTGVGLVRARSEARRANQAAATAEATAVFLAGLFRGGDPRVAQGAELSAADLLERGRERLATELADQPATRAKLLETIGTVYRNLGLLEESEATLRQALELRRRLAVGGSRTAGPGTGAREGAGGDAGEGEGAGAGAREIEDAPVGGGERELANALLELSTTLKERGGFDEAATLMAEAGAIMNASLEPGDPLRLSILTSTGLLYRDRAQPERAGPPLAQALAEARGAPDLPPHELATLLNNLALHYRSARRSDEAEPLFVAASATAVGAPAP